MPLKLNTYWLHRCICIAIVDDIFGVGIVSCELGFSRHMVHQEMTDKFDFWSFFYNIQMCKTEAYIHVQHASTRCMRHAHITYSYEHLQETKK